MSFKDSRSEDPWSIWRAKRAQKSTFSIIFMIFQFFGCMSPTLSWPDLRPQNFLDHEAWQEPRYILQLGSDRRISKSNGGILRNLQNPTSPLLFSDYQTFANNTPGWEQYCFRRQPYYLFLPSLQAMWILKIRVARTLDQFQGPNVLRNRVFRSFSSFSNFSVAWTRPWSTPISGHRIFWTMRLGRNQDTYFN